MGLLINVFYAFYYFQGPLDLRIAECYLYMKNRLQAIIFFQKGNMIYYKSYWGLWFFIQTKQEQTGDVLVFLLYYSLAVLLVTFHLVKQNHMFYFSLFIFFFLK